MPRPTLELTTGDVPQAPNLARIRCVVTAIAGGAATIEQVAEETDVSSRHVSYSIRAAQILGLLDAAKQPTLLGRGLLETEQESAAERDVFKSSVEGSEIVRALARACSPRSRPPRRRSAPASSA